MQKLRDFAPKISDAIFAMVNGMHNQFKRKDFKIFMPSFGEYDGQFCYGCAATCAIQEIMKQDLKGSEMKGTLQHARALHLDWDEVKAFEWGIDMFRIGEPAELMTFYKLFSAEKRAFNELFLHAELPYIVDYNAAVLEQYALFANNLKSFGL